MAVFGILTGMIWLQFFLNCDTIYWESNLGSILFLTSLHAAWYARHFAGLSVILIFLLIFFLL